jgi:hypothetical protein
MAYLRMTLALYVEISLAILRNTHTTLFRVHHTQTQRDLMCSSSHVSVALPSLPALSLSKFKMTRYLDTKQL